MTTAEVKRQVEGLSGVSNVAFDLLTILENKLQGVAAMEEYLLDCGGDAEVRALLQDLQRREVEDVARVKSLLVKRLA